MRAVPIADDRSFGAIPSGCLERQLLAGLETPTSDEVPLGLPQTRPHSGTAHRRHEVGGRGRKTMGDETADLVGELYSPELLGASLVEGHRLDSDCALSA